MLRVYGGVFLAGLVINLSLMFADGAAIPITLAAFFAAGIWVVACLERHVRSMCVVFPEVDEVPEEDPAAEAAEYRREIMAELGSLNPDPEGSRRRYKFDPTPGGVPVETLP